MAALGQLVVSLSANIAQFTGAMDRAAYVSEQRMRQIEKSVKAAAVAVGAAGAAAASALGVLVKTQIDAADEAAKMAQKMGITVESLTALQYAAGLSGVTNEQLESSFVKLSKAAADGNPAFVAMGISIRDASGEIKSADRLFSEVAEKFSGYRDGVEKTALAQDLLGKSGAAMIPMLNSGSAGLKGFADEAARFGYIVDTETAKAAEKFNDDLSKMQFLMQGVGRSIIKDLLPVINDLTEAFLDSQRAGLGFFDLLQVKAPVGKSDFAKNIKDTTREIERLQAIIDDQDQPKGTAYEDLERQLKLREYYLRRLGAEAAKDATNYGNEARAVLDQALVTAPVIESVKKLKTTIKETKKEIETMWSPAEAGVASFEAMVEDARRTYDETRTPVEQLASRLSRLQELLDAGMFGQRQSAEAWDIYTRAVMKAQDEFDNLTKTVEEDTDVMKTYAEQAARGIQDAFAEFLFDPFKGGVNGMLENFTVMLRKMAAQQLAAGLLKGLGNWGSTGGGQGTFIGGIVSSIFKGGRANGGPVEAGRSYLVGERGPELIHIGAQGGTVTPTEKLMGKQVTVINNFTFDRPVDRRTQEQVAAMAGGAIQIAMRRNG